MKENCKCEMCENCECKKCMRHHGKMHGHGHAAASGGGIYFLGFIGAAVFFISQASDFWAGVVAFLKAMVWPAFMIYEAFRFLIG
jgi:hypothetical protein